MALRNLTTRAKGTEVLWTGEVTAIGEVVYFPEPLDVGDGLVAYGIYVPDGERWVVPTNVSVYRSARDGHVRKSPWSLFSFDNPEGLRRRENLRAMEDYAEYYSAVTEGDQ